MPNGPTTAFLSFMTSQAPAEATFLSTGIPGLDNILAAA
jgi:hypothetical protein